MNEQNVNRRTVSVLQKVVSPGIKVSVWSSLGDDLALDSLELIEALSKLEEEFSMSVPLEDLPCVSTVEDVANVIERLCLQIGGN